MTPIDRFHTEKRIAWWCAWMCVAAVFLAQLIVPQRKEVKAAEPIDPVPYPCECQPPDGYSAAMYCTGGVHLEMRK